MARTVAIGIQDFSKIIENNYFYVDKTAFLREWWESGDEVTMITRPRRFGKTLTMSMTEQFFSVGYADRGDLFEGLDIWKAEKYRRLQGTYPVISLSFANVKERDYRSAKQRIGQLLADLYGRNYFLLESGLLTEADKKYFLSVGMDMPEVVATSALYKLSDFLCRYYKKKVILLLDEYDTPMQEAYVNGYWQELVQFTRSLFHSGFKTNPWLERALMTGITRISKESVFSDLNNLKVVTTTSDEYAATFGFTEEEVFASMDEYGYDDKKTVKCWYDGFVFGCHKDIYNPWSILNYLDKGKVAAYWANTSSNSLVGKLIREGSKGVKQSFERLLNGEHLLAPIDEQIVYSQLDGDEQSIWSLLLASGYLKVLGHGEYDSEDILLPEYELALTNYEVSLMFKGMVKKWFAVSLSDYNDFVKAMLEGDLESMNEYMNRVACEMFSFFDTGRRASERAEPERFYHGFVLGLMVDLGGRYVITSKRESGFGRYDIMLEPGDGEKNAYVIEFKVYNPRKEGTLEDTVRAALDQIEAKNYAAVLTGKGIPKERIYKYGFAFEGKKVLIGGRGDGVF